MKNFAIALTGASGMPYAKRVLEILVKEGHRVHLVVSTAATKVLQVEEDVVLKAGKEKESILDWLCIPTGTSTNLVLHDQNDVSATIASGSYPIDGMAIVPCSGGTLGRVAYGISKGLIERASDVCLKERRKLILVPRETPLSAVHLENMLKVTQAGAVVLPASPGFYMRPKTILDLVDMVASRVLAHLGVPNEAQKRWMGMPKKEVSN